MEAIAVLPMSISALPELRSVGLWAVKKKPAAGGKPVPIKKSIIRLLLA